MIMDEIRNLLDRNRSELVNDIDIKHGLLNDLQSAGVLLPTHVASIKAHRIEMKQIEELLDILKRRGFGYYKNFIRILNVTQPDVAAKIDISLEDIKEKNIFPWESRGSLHRNVVNDNFSEPRLEHRNVDIVNDNFSDEFKPNQLRKQLEDVTTELKSVLEQNKELKIKLEKNKDLEEEFFQVSLELKNTKKQCNSLTDNLELSRQENENLKSDLNSKVKKISELENLLQRKTDEKKTLEIRLMEIEEKFPRFANELTQSGTNIQVKDGGLIMGMAMLNKRIYFVCLKKKKLYVFSDEPPYNQIFSEEFEIQGLRNPRDLVCSEKEKLLFISDENDGENHKIWQLSVAKIQKGVTFDGSQSYTLREPRGFLQKQQSLDIDEADKLYKVTHFSINRKPGKMFICPVENKQVGTLLAVLVSSYQMSCVEEYFIYIYKVNQSQIFKQVLVNSDLGEIFHVIIQPPILKSSQSINFSNAFESDSSDDPLSKTNFIISHKTVKVTETGETKTVWNVSKLSCDGSKVINSISPPEVDGVNFNESEYLALGDGCRILVADHKNDRLVILGPKFNGSQVLVKKTDKNRFEKPSRIFYHILKRMVIVSHRDIRGTFSVFSH